MDAMRVDGNVLAGLLADVFASDATLLVGTCGECGSRSPLAESIVELDDECAIVICRGCTHTLLTVLRTPSGARLVFGALATIEV